MRCSLLKNSEFFRIRMNCFSARSDSLLSSGVPGSRSHTVNSSQWLSQFGLVFVDLADGVQYHLAFGWIVIFQFKDLPSGVRQAVGPNHVLLSNTKES